MSAVAGAAGASLLLTAGSAPGDCLAPTPRLVWSSPEAGATDVPIDADLLLLTEAIDLPHAEVSIFVGGLLELPVEPGSDLPGHYDLPDLEADQVHTIVVRHESDTPITIRFTTGQQRAANDAGAVEVVSVSQASFVDGLVDGLCSDVLFRNSCFDTGTPPLQTFEVDTDLSPVGERSLWAIETSRAGSPASRTQSWPAACGSPRQWGGPASAEYRLYNIGENGLIRESNVLAHTFEMPPRRQPEPPQSVSSGITCNLSVGLRSPWRSLAAAGALSSAALWRRRRARV